MIDLVNKTITLGSSPKPITGFAVWFATPWGLITNLDEAVTRCSANDVDPDMNIHALPVALTADSYEVLK